VRTSHLRPALQAAGALFAERNGAEVVSVFSDAATENGIVRNSVGLTDFSFAQIYRIPEEKAVDFLDSFLAGNVARTRFGRVLHTFLPDENGNVAADCYVANNDQEFILICESIIDTEAVNGVMESYGAKDAGVEDWTGQRVMLSLDGVDAWKVVREVFGQDVLGLPYLSVEVYPYEGENVLLLRAGKTSEFGYLLIAPNGVAQALYDKLLFVVKELGGGLCGVDVHNDLRLEGRFFNIHKEGVQVRDPLVLGLQWMIDFEKAGGFRGSEAILARRSAGLTRKMIGVSVSASCDSLRPGAKIFHNGLPVAEVVASCRSLVLDRNLGLAVFPVELAYSGLDFTLASSGGPAVRTISMPPILPKSLGVRLSEM
jgi:aminomethyltransferase